MATAIVTGGEGFIGSHVVDALLAEGRRVVVIDDLSAGRVANVNEAAELVQVDITDGEALAAAIDAARPAAIFHLAAQASVTASVDDPLRDCRVNVEGTLNVLESARRHGASVVFTSTGGALYGDEAPLPTPESYAARPLSPYGASKLAAEAYVRAWSDAHGTPNAVCRLGNVYGPRQSPHGEAGVVAIFSHRLWSGEGLVVYGHGSPTRDYVHVHDVVSALIAVSGRAGTFNVGTGEETDVASLLEHLETASGRSVPVEQRDLRVGELRRSCLDSTELRATTGWAPSVAIADGLATTYASLVEGFAAAG